MKIKIPDAKYGIENPYWEKQVKLNVERYKKDLIKKIEKKARIMEEPTQFDKDGKPILNLEVSAFVRLSDIIKIIKSNQ